VGGSAKMKLIKKARLKIHK
jgi:hypothetical protein